MGYMRRRGKDELTRNIRPRNECALNGLRVIVAACGCARGSFKPRALPNSEGILPFCEAIGKNTALTR